MSCGVGLVLILKAMTDDLHAQRAVNPVREGLDRTGLYHSFRLPDGRVLEGAMPLEYQDVRWAAFGLPEDLTGQRALDIGPWDGYFTFELERRGAQVMAIDYTDLDTFRRLHQLFASRADYRQMEVYEVSPEATGTFDIVLFLGVLYHLKHPLLALEKICAITTGACFIDSFVVDPEAYRNGQNSPIPYAEFYETGELGGQLDNWCGPTVSQVLAWARASGFAQATVMNVTGTTVCVRADRHWQNLPPVTDPPLNLLGVNSPTRGGRTFDTRKEEYLAFWCPWTGPAPTLDTIYPEVDGFGIAPMFCKVTETSLMVNTRLPPGLEPGVHQARLRVAGSDWSPPVEFFVDLPALAGEIQVRAIQDGVILTDEVEWNHGGWLTVWVEGLSEWADVGNVIVEVDGVPHRPQAVTMNQINLRLRPLFTAGDHILTVTHRHQQSLPVTFQLQGTAPGIKGLP